MFCIDTDDMGMLNLRWFDFKHDSIYATASAASKNNARFKSGQI